MALVYNGQESFLDHRLAFFERDPIAWKQFELADFYTRLLQWRRSHPALGNGQYGGSLRIIEIDNDAVFSFTRERGGRSVAVTVAVNLSGRPQTFAAPGGTRQSLAPWAWTFDAI
jgi:glycosidase